MGARLSAENTGSGSTRWGWLVALGGVLLRVAPIMLGAHAYWAGFAWTIGLPLAIVGIVLASEGVPDGPPIRRSG